MGSSDVHLRTGRPGRALHQEACPLRPGLRWGPRCPWHTVKGWGGTQGQTPDLTVAPVQTPACSDTAAWTRELHLSPWPRVHRSVRAQGPAGVGERGPEGRTECIAFPAVPASGQVS